MILLDVNVLVYAYASTVPDHEKYRDWLNNEINLDRPFGLSELALSGFLRIVTNRRVFKPPATVAEAMVFVDALRSRPNCIIINPTPNHWPIFKQLCLETNATGKLVPDAYFAALVIEHDCEWITADTDFAQFSRLKWRHPLT